MSKEREVSMPYTGSLALLRKLDWKLKSPQSFVGNKVYEVESRAKVCLHEEF